MRSYLQNLNNSTVEKNIFLTYVPRPSKLLAQIIIMFVKEAKAHQKFRESLEQIGSSMKLKNTGTNTRAWGREWIYLFVRTNRIVIRKLFKASTKRWSMDADLVVQEWRANMICDISTLSLLCREGDMILSVWKLVGIGDNFNKLCFD